MFIGIDVAKDELVEAVRPSGELSTVPNAPAGMRSLMHSWRETAPTLIVLEATGRYEALVATWLAATGLPVSVTNRRHARDFAKVTGQLAKTDQIDAMLFAQFAD